MAVGLPLSFVKAYPRLYSLCTLNLRHHQAFEYKFHSLRTDFVGESGSGKSMIADMLQLIFVGSAAFQAATQGLEGQRHPQGMVLPGETFGYVFLNIQCAFKEFLVIGAQLENTSNSTRLFIIHKGFGISDKGKLLPLNAPFGVHDFQQDGLILPLDDVRERLIERGCEVLCPTTKNYHKLLYQNHILPLDLSYSPKTLDNYAKIIQAFSRKKSLDPKNPRELQNFLFGNEPGQEIYKEYEKSVNELQQAENQYRNNREKVNQIGHKGRSLNELRGLQEKFEKAKRTYLANRLAYWQYQYRERTTKLQNALNACFQAQTDLEHWHSYCLTQHTMADSTIISLKEAVRQANFNLQQVTLPYQRLLKASRWITDLECDVNTIAMRFSEQTGKAKKKKDLENLLLILKQQGLLDLFNRSDWRLGFEKGRKWAEGQIAAIAQQIEQKELLREFTDVSEGHSLAAWAVDYSCDLDLIQVSVLAGLRDLPQFRPPTQKGARYIPDPNTFFENLPQYEEDGNGFWLYIGGIEYYFDFADDLHRELKFPDRRKAFFTSWTTSLVNDLAKLAEELRLIQRLTQVLERSEETRAGVDAYLQRSELEAFKLYEGFASLSENFVDYHNCLLNADMVERNYKTAGQASERATDNLHTGTTNFNRLKDRFQDIGSIIARHQPIVSNLKDWLTERSTTFKQVVCKLPPVSEEATKNFDSINFAIQNTATDLLTDAAWRQLKEGWTTALYERQQAEAEYKAAYQSVPEDLPNQYCPPEPSGLRDTYREAELAYQSAFKAIVSLYLLNDAYKLGDDYNFVELAHCLLPGLFEQEDITAEGVLSRITQRLNEINETNRALNIRKLSRIRELLNLVEDARRTIWTSVNSMQSFFERKENEITGGYKAVLSIQESRNFPFVWIRVFKRELSNPEFAERFMDAISLKEKMQKAFELCGGYSNQVHIQDLLNPNSYVELSYSMKSATETNNAGSTGQTYAAIALLCIARLSLIHEKQRKGIRFMPVDEAEGLGSNFHLLYRIAKQYDYQIISFSPNLVGSFEEGDQYIHMLAKDMDSPNPVNFRPMGIFKQSDLTDLANEDSGEGDKEDDDNDDPENPDDEPPADEV